MDACNTGNFIMENFEMLKALYDFQAVYPKTISFDEGEHFVLYQTSAKQRNWWQVVSMKGSIGFVPSNYVMKIKVEPSFLLGFLESSIASLERSGDEDVNGIISRVELIERLRVKRTQASVSAKILESDSDTNGAYDNEKNYTEGRSDADGAATRSRAASAAAAAAAAAAADGSDGSDSDNSSAQGAAATPAPKPSSKKKKSAPTPPTKQSVPESASMPRIDTAAVSQSAVTTTAAAAATAATAAATGTSSTSSNGNNATIGATASDNNKHQQYDNSIASEPSETTTTCSDDATVISLAKTAAPIDDQQPASALLDPADADLPPDAPPKQPVPAAQLDAERDDDDDDDAQEQPPPLPPKGETTKVPLETAAAVSAKPTTTAPAAAIAPPPPPPVVSAASPSPSGGIIPAIIEPPLAQRYHNHNHNGPPTAAANGGGAAASHPGSPSSCCSSSEQTLRVDAAEVYQIIDTIRQTTNLSHRLSCVALQVVLAELETIYSTRILHFLEPIAVHLTGTEPLQAPADCREQTHDAQRMKCIFAKLRACTDDEEQRTWVLHEDEAYIARQLAELVEIVRNADATVCRAALAADQCDGVQSLVRYYQMETRWSIRGLLLEAFRGLCAVDPVRVVDGVLLVSVLPTVLVQDMRAQVRMGQRLREVAVMLTMVLSLGGKMAMQHREHINANFVTFVVSLIEQSATASSDAAATAAAADDDDDDQDLLADICVNLLIALNLQYDEATAATENVVVQALRDVPVAKTFTEKILVLLNRDEDPLKFFEDAPKAVPNAVLKLFVDLFATAETAALFYSNDNKVLIDILVRQLSDLSAGDALRRAYLELCRRIVRNTDYADHQHRKGDLMKVFTRIFCEEGDCSRSDQQLVRAIANEFPLIFKA